MPRSLLAVAVAVASAAIGSEASAQLAPEAFRLGAFVPVEDPRELDLLERLRAHLQSELAQPVVLETFGLSEIEAPLKAGRFDAVILQPVLYAAHRDQAGLRRLLTRVRRARDGTPMTQMGGVLFTRADADGLSRPEDLRGRALGAAGPLGFGAYLMQRRFLLERGLDPSRDMSVHFLGTPQKRIVRAVLDGTVDVGALRTGVLEQLFEAGELRPDEVRVLSAVPANPDFPFVRTTRLYAEFVFAVSEELSEGRTRRLAVALLEVRDQRGEAVWTVPETYEETEALLRALRLPPFEAVASSKVAEGVMRALPYVLALVALLLVGLCVQFVLRRAEKARARELRRLNRALNREKARTEQASRVKSAFLAMAGHEVRTPLNGVLSALELLEQSPLSGESADAVADLRGATGRMASVLDNVLISAELMTDAVDSHADRLELRPFLEARVSDAAGRASKLGVEMEVRADEGAPSVVQLSSTRLEQALDRLLDNALKFGAPGRVLVQLGADDDSWSLGIRDEGPGIEEEELGKLMRPFTQLSAGSRRRFGGLGLGLAIVRSLAEVMGGKLEVESEPGAGSTFTLRLPLSSTDDAAEAWSFRPPAAKAAQPTRPHRVLVVDDDRMNLRMLCGLIRRINDQIEVVEARDGAAAVLLVSEQAPFDLVLMDLHMPGQDGLSATQTLKKDPTSPRVVMVTASSSESELAACLSAGAEEIIPKPVDRARVERVLRSLDPQP